MTNKNDKENNGNHRGHNHNTNDHSLLYPKKLTIADLEKTGKIYSENNKDNKDFEKSNAGKLLKWQQDQQ